MIDKNQKMEGTAFEGDAAHLFHFEDQNFNQDVGLEQSVCWIITLKYVC